MNLEQKVQPSNLPITRNWRGKTELEEESSAAMNFCPMAQVNWDPMEPRMIAWQQNVKQSLTQNVVFYFSTFQL